MTTFQQLADEQMVKLAQKTLDVQDACNLSGIVNSMNDMLATLRQRTDCQGSRWIACHPITKLWIDKLCDLSGVTRDLQTEAYSDVVNLSKGTPCVFSF